jgi:hypothetical protein
VTSLSATFFCTSTPRSFRTAFVAATEWDSDESFATTNALWSVPQQKKWVNDELCDFLVTIDPSKSSLQNLWLFLGNTDLETKRGNEGKLESERGSEDSGLPLDFAG